MSLTIAAAQSASFPGEVSRNVAHHLQIASVAAAHGVRFLLFPELSLTGYELDLARDNVLDPDSPVLDSFRRYATAAAMTIVAGAPLRASSGDLNIGALVFAPNGTVQIHTKEHVHESERHVFTPGSGGPCVVVGGLAVALAICADASHPSHAAQAAGLGADVYAVSAMITGDAWERKTAQLKRYAIEQRMAVLLANYSGISGGEPSAGKSAIWSHTGERVACCKGTDQALILATLHNRQCVASVITLEAVPPCLSTT